MFTAKFQTFDDPAGHKLIAVGLGLQVLGYLIIKKIVTIEV